MTIHHLQTDPLLTKPWVMNLMLMQAHQTSIIMLLGLQVQSLLTKNLQDWIFETVPESLLSGALHHLEVSRQMTMKNLLLLKMTRILFLESDWLPRQMTPMIPPMALTGYCLLSMNILPFKMLTSMYSPMLHLGLPLMFNRRTALSHSIPPSPLLKILTILLKAWTIWQ